MALTTSHITLWPAINALAKQISFSKLKVENVLSVRLDEVKRNTYTVFFEGVPSISPTDEESPRSICG